MQRLLLFWICLAFTLHAFPQSDTAQHLLRDVDVRAYRNRSSLRSDADGTLHLDLKLMDELPKIMGNADPLHFTQMMPAVSTNSEFDAGFHLQGCATSQSLLAIGHAPVYNAAHVLGFFSTFIPTHFKELSLRTTTDASTPNVLGGVLRMHSAQEPEDSLSGSLAVGPMSSQGTIHLPMGRNHSITLSARQSYVNLLYGHFIKFDDSHFGYRFGDYNVSYAGRFGRHRLVANAYYGQDRVAIDRMAQGIDMRVVWQNMLATADLYTQTQRGGLLEQSLYTTSYNNNLRIDIANIRGTMPSHITTYGYRLSHRPLPWKNGRHQLQYSLHLQQHDITPQSPEVIGGYQTESLPAERQHATEASAFLLYRWQPAKHWSVESGVKQNVYRLWTDNVVTNVHTDPSLRLAYDSRETGTLSLTLARAHQYTHQAGFSSVGLPTEFRFASDRLMPAQEAWGATLSFNRQLWRGKYKLTAELYGKRMWHQLEYSTDVMDIITTGFSLDKSINHGQGYNCGVNLQMVKQAGRLTGWMSYAFGVARRHFDDIPGEKHYFPSNYERLHELNAVATYRISDGWSVGGTLVFASGTPFTPITYIYYLHNKLMREYGEHNSARLTPYLRLDLSVNYRFRPRHRTRSGLNFSVYNATMHDNAIYYRLKIYNGHYSYRPTYFFMRALPSINYFLEF